MRSRVKCAKLQPVGLPVGLRGWRSGRGLDDREGRSSAVLSLELSLGGVACSRQRCRLGQQGRHLELRQEDHPHIAEEERHREEERLDRVAVGLEDPRWRKRVSDNTPNALNVV